MKGICFKEPLFHATIEGRKTQTRRLIEPQPKGNYHGLVEYTKRNIQRILRKFDFTCGISATPKYQVGEIVYLKEPYSTYGDAPIWYKYDSLDIHACVKGWRNKLFMPATAARHFIKITAVRAERLQDISDSDCMREGIWMAENVGRKGISYWYPGCVNSPHVTPQQAYAALIDKINGKGTWDSNPWVWVYDYELTEKPA